MEAQVQVHSNYESAARAVLAGSADAFASVSRAHTAFLSAHNEALLELVQVPAAERPPAPGAFAMHPQNERLLAEFNAVLDMLVGTPKHVAMMQRFGITEEEYRFN